MQRKDTKKWISFLLIILLLTPSFIGLFWTGTLYAFSGLENSETKDNLYSLLKGLVMLFLLNKVVGGEDSTQITENPGDNSQSAPQDSPQQDSQSPSDNGNSSQSDGDSSGSDDGSVDIIEQPPATSGDSSVYWTKRKVTDLTAAEEKMLKLLNEERKKRGLNPLKIDLRLVKVARAKSRDMIENDYFAHQSPTYGSPFDMMKEVGIKYQFAGENIAGAPNVERAHQALMNSKGHRENILRPRFTHVGIGIVKGGKYGMMFSQEFIDADFN